MSTHAYFFRFWTVTQFVSFNVTWLAQTPSTQQGFVQVFLSGQHNPLNAKPVISYNDGSSIDTFRNPLLPKPFVPIHKPTIQSYVRTLDAFWLFSVRIVIRGEVNTGKTALWHRLQGHKFSTAYHPSESIQIAHIPWSYKGINRGRHLLPPTSVSWKRSFSPSFILLCASCAMGARCLNSFWLWIVTDDNVKVEVWDVVDKGK